MSRYDVTPVPRAGDRWWVVLAAGAVVFMATLDASVVVVALPALQHELGITTALGQWVLLGYLVPVIAVTLPAGRWIDRVGLRAAMICGTAGFGAASLLVGLAPTFAPLVAARVVQGAFAGVLFALLPVVVTRSVRPGARGRAMGLTAAVGPLGAVSGPSVGGVLVDAWGWPWIFWVNLPSAALVVGVMALQLPHDGPLRRPERGAVGEALVVGGAAAVLLVACSAAGSGRPASFVLLLALVPLTLAWRRRESSRPVLEVYRRPVVRHTELALFGSAGASSALMFLLPFFLQLGQGRSAAAAGTVLMALPLATAVTGPLGGALADRWGPATPAVVGAVPFVAGTVLLLSLDATWSTLDLVWRLALAGAGMGIFYGPNLTLMLAAAPTDRLGIVAASSSLVRQLGFAVGPAAGAVAWAAGGHQLPGMRAGLGVAVLGALGVLGASVAAARHTAARHAAARHGGTDQHRPSSAASAATVTTRKAS